MAVDLFTPVVPEGRQHPSFRAVASEPGFLPARLMLAQVASDFDDKDGNFVEQFQSTGFDARLWELYLFAALTEWGFSLDAGTAAPDFITAKAGTTICLEGVTVNPSQGTAAAEAEGAFAGMTGKERALQQWANHYPIKFGSVLFSKLRKEYWKLPGVAGRPFILAVEDFQETGSMTSSGSALDVYLTGYRHNWGRTPSGTLDIEPRRVESHVHGNKVIPSGFFDLDGAEHVSAVLFSNSGTIAKFNRLGLLAGHGQASVMLFRYGTCYDHQPESDMPLWFEYEVGYPGFPEDWKQGISLYHNPRAVLPVDQGLFPGVAHHEFRSDGMMVSMIPRFHPFGSNTLIVPVPDHPHARAYIRHRVALELDDVFKQISRAGYPGVLDLLDRPGSGTRGGA